MEKSNAVIWRSGAQSTSRLAVAISVYVPGPETPFIIQERRIDRHDPRPSGRRWGETSYQDGMRVPATASDSRASATGSRSGGAEPDLSVPADRRSCARKKPGLLEAQTVAAVARFPSRVPRCSSRGRHRWYRHFTRFCASAPKIDASHPSPHPWRFSPVLASELTDSITMGELCTVSDCEFALSTG